jgi:hypothetical protein
MSREERLLRKIDKQILAIQKEELGLDRGTKQSRKCDTPIMDVSKSFNYLLESAAHMNSEFFDCLINSKKKKDNDKCLKNIIKSIGDIECQDIKKKVGQCSKNPKIKKKTLDCIVKAKTASAVKKCIGVQLHKL